MGCEVTFHDKISQDQLAAAMAPQTSSEFINLLESAIDETVRRRSEPVTWRSS